ncbi:hypothetical protein SAMN05414139_08886 [Burkholderia sp. D7]|nr:hypothetical protein SAMN05414139_08886 [Burkholderia sp. D7]
MVLRSKRIAQTLNATFTMRSYEINGPDKESPSSLV